jgi:hypothetical protein
MLMGSGEMIALQTSLKRFPKIPFAYKRASLPFPRCNLLRGL